MRPPQITLAAREAAVEVNRSPEEVYDVIADITRMGEWSPECTGGEWLDGGSGKAGDWFRGHNRSGDREWSRECEVARADWGRDFTFVVAGVEANCTWWSYEMEPIGGGTRLTERWWVVNKTPGLQAATPEQLQARIDGTQGMLESTLAAIKRTIEGS